MKIIHNNHKKYRESFEIWQKWFAWYPVDIEGNKIIWLEWVERKREASWGEVWWVYREIK